MMESLENDTLLLLVHRVSVSVFSPFEFVRLVCTLDHTSISCGPLLIRSSCPPLPLSLGLFLLNVFQMDL